MFQYLDLPDITLLMCADVLLLNLRRKVFMNGVALFLKTWDRSFMYKLLESFNFSESFIRWIKTLYCNP